MRYLITLLALFLFSSTYAQNNDAPLSKHAPADRVTKVYDEQLRSLDSMIAPYVQQAKKSYPAAKQRYLKELPTGEAFFVVTRIFDRDGKFEQVFIRVKEIKDGFVSGNIANELGLVKEYKYDQLIRFEEAKIVDWVITKPDGKEEGNFIGKFMDSQ